MKTKHIFCLISVSLHAGFALGLFFSFCDIDANQYIQNNLFRIAVLSLQDNLNRWVSILLASCLLLLILFFLVLFLWRFVLNVIEIRFKDSNRFKLIQPFRHPAFASLSAAALNSYNFINIAALTGIAFLFLLNIGVFSDKKTNDPSGPNIVLIVIDCLRPDHLGCYNYTRDTSPAIDDLAKNGVLFQNAYSCAPWTKPSVASIFTSIYPNEHGVINFNDILPDGVVTIAEFLKNKGYYTSFFNGGNFCIGKHFNFSQGFDYYCMLPYKSFKATGLTNNFMEQISRIYPKKFFAYIHYMEPHNPYNKNSYNNLFTKQPLSYLQPGVDYVSSWHIRIMTNNDRMPEEDMSHVISLYDAQIRFVDESIKRIVAFLKEKNIFDNTLIIITSDHGEEFWEHNNYEHGHTLYNELLHVPLIISGNKLKPAVTTKMAGLMDLFPSILDFADIKGDRSFCRGISMKKEMHGERDKSQRPFFFTSTLYGDEKYSLIKDNMKIILNSSETKNKERLYGYSSTDSIEIYNLLKDPEEQHNLVGADQKTLSLLKKELQEFRALNSKFEDTEFVIDNDLKNKLEAIGYITN